MTDNKININHVEPVSQKEIEALGVRPRRRAAPHERGEDILERYIRVPNRIFFVYTTEDKVLSEYISSNWAALDGISGDVCDIYTSVMQLENEEDAYSFADDIKGIPGSGFVRIDNLPCILLWSDNAALSLSVRDFANELHIVRTLLRKIFDFLHKIKRGILLEDKYNISSIIDEINEGNNRSSSRRIVINGGVIMNNEINKVDRGSVILGRNAVARDIKTNSSNVEAKDNLDMTELSKQLAVLRKKMREEAQESPHFEHAFCERF